MTVSTSSKQKQDAQKEEPGLHKSPLRTSRGAFYVGLDLGQASDYTALVIVEQLTTYDHVREREPGPWSNDSVKSQSLYHVRHIERFPLGTSYPAITRSVIKRLEAPVLRGNATLVVDKTGVGRAPVDLLREAGLAPVGVTIHGGDAVSRDGANDYRVPKRDLAGTVKVLLQNGQLKIADGMPLTHVLTEELLNFRVKRSEITGHDSYEAWREQDHDDVVLATALACWFPEHGIIPRVRLLYPLDEWDDDL